MSDGAVQRFDGGAAMIEEERQELLNNYAAASREFSDAVERLRRCASDGEAFIQALSDTGTARRACERSRIKLDKYLSQIRTC